MNLIRYNEVVGLPSKRPKADDVMIPGHPAEHGEMPTSEKAAAATSTPPADNCGGRSNPTSFNFWQILGFLPYFAGWCFSTPGHRELSISNHTLEKSVPTISRFNKECTYESHHST